MIGTYLTILISVVALVISWISLRLAIRNQPKYHREFLYSKQFDFFINLSGEIDKYSLLLFDYHKIQNEETKFELSEHTEKIDLFISKHGILLDSIIFDKSYDFLEIIHRINRKVTKLELVTSAEVDKVNYFIYDFQEDLREAIGVDKLNKENKRILYLKEKNL